MNTFTATIALHDDYGQQWSADDLTWEVTTSLPSGTSLFTVAIGDGIDSDTGEREPVAVYQGATNDIPAARAVFEAAAIGRNQRAIGWVESTDSYHYVGR